MNPAIYYLSSLELFPDYIPTPIQIGDQIWDQKNLNTVRYSDGTPLARTNNFLTSTVGQWRYYNDNSSNAAVYGRLYNWYAAVGIYNSASLSNPALRKDIAPTGWRVATEADWAELSTYLLGDTVSGGKLKETGLSHWASPNTGATNSSLFTALPGGFKSGTTGAFSNITLNGYWWVYNSVTLIVRILDYSSAALTSSTSFAANSGRSIRLIKILPPVVITTTTISNINYTTADTGGNITNDGGNAVIARGVCWSIYIDPTVALATKTSNGTGIGSFTSSLTGLVSGTYYYVRAYATNSLGTTYYGNNVLFQTLTTAYTPILDSYPTSVHHAYSLRKLKTSYSGFCLRVRRTAITTTEVNVGFDSNGAIGLTSPISTIIGAGTTTATTLGQFAAIPGYGAADAGVTANQSIFVVTWYDQSGNGKNPTNSTTAQQPKLVTNGNLETSGGKVSVRFTRSSTTILTITDTTANINNMASYFVGQYATIPNTNSTGSVGYSLSGGVSTTARFQFPIQFSLNSSSQFAGYGSNIVGIVLDTTANTDRKLYELISPTVGSTTLVQGWSNGVAKTTRTIVNAATASINLGGAGTASTFDGYIQEVIGWQTNLDRLNKETNINAYWTIYP